MIYVIQISSSAAKDFKKLERSIQRRVQNAIESLKSEPRPHGVKKLKGADNLWRVRIGDYRVVYSIEDEQVLVLVIRIRHRRDVY